MLSRLKFLSLLALCLVIAACSQSNNTEQVLTPTPLAEQPTTTAETQAVEQAADQAAGAVSNQTALTAETPTAPATNVVDQQLNANVGTQATEVAALEPDKSISFLPVEGMPQSAVTSFSNSMKQASQTHGFKIVPSNQPDGKYRVKGYFSALNDGSGTLVTYIWDIVDASGKRLHRINGQERNGSASVQPWSTVTDDQLKRVADTTAARIKSWLDARG